MTRHKLNRNEFRLENGEVVTIEYWIDAANVHVAAFGADGYRLSRVTYHASVDSPTELNPELQESLIDSLANALEYALIRKPQLHVRER
ncbi:MAG: hypothetical protein Q7U91_11810 [Sideroxyarcus sp.]|nr:hypothetical protein [Sideroxyarcus sp.]